MSAISQIGYRFALYEMKVIIFALLRHVAFERQPPEPPIEKGPTYVYPTGISKFQTDPDRC